MTAIHRYTLDVEYNSNPAYHPITVTVTRQGERREFSGKTLASLLAKASKHIGEEEDEES
jgi:hypothetical protein